MSLSVACFIHECFNIEECDVQYCSFCSSKSMISKPSPLVNMSKATDKEGRKKEKET